MGRKSTQPSVGKEVQLQQVWTLVINGMHAFAVTPDRPFARPNPALRFLWGGRALRARYTPTPACPSRPSAPAAGLQPSRPPQQWQAAHDALALYRRGKRERALAELDALLQDQPSGAACLARAKLHVTQAIDAGLKVDTPAPGPVPAQACSSLRQLRQGCA